MGRIQIQMTDEFIPYAVIPKPTSKFKKVVND